MARHVGDPGAVLASTVTAVPALAFVPVAAHFNLFSLLVGIGPTATADALTEACNVQRSETEKQDSPLCLRLTQDTMFAMAGLGFVDLVDEDTYRVNAITNHIHDIPSAIHGMIHFTTEPVFAAPFLMKKLRDTRFAYPFAETSTPFQYGHELLGHHDLAQKDFYGILHSQGRLPSFNIFMEGKFGKFGTMPERVAGFGYDLGAIIKDAGDDFVLVDIGGGKGEMLLETKQAFPNLQKHNLVLQEFQPDLDDLSADLTVMDWDFKSESAQPIQSASLYSLTHIYHNLPDLDAVTLMQKMSAAMGSNSRMLIHEFSKNANYGKMSSAMVLQFGGRTRGSRDWHKMASLCGLEVTFEAYPEIGEGLVEMRKRS